MEQRTELKAVDFFCAGGGMSYGLQEAGINVIAGIDIDESCKATYESNIKDAKFIHHDIFKLNEIDLGKKIPIDKNDDKMIFIGCSPCQFWSVMRTDKSKAIKSSNLLCEFLRFVQFYNPGYVIVENVPGILKRKTESKLDEFIKALQNGGYDVHYKVVNLNDYGVPQSRRRFTLIANRCGEEVSFPKKHSTKVTVRDVIGDYNTFPKISAGHKDTTDFLHTTAGLSDINIKRLMLTSHDGGNRESWADTDMQLETYKKNNVSFKDTYGRMFWDKPAPTITTKFFSISNGRFAHPDQLRPISLREGAALQTFPNHYKFKGTSISIIAKIIGNAVPPHYSRQIGLAILKKVKGGK